MVSTRNHPKNFPPPDISPSKKSRSTMSPEPESSDPVVYVPTSGSAAKNAIISSRSGARALPAWSHTVTNGVLAWFAISLPLVLWDVGYCLGRPHTMPNGKWHLPLWKPYAIYVDIDYLYGFEALARQDGFTGAQSFMNIVETAMYVFYMALVFTKGTKTGKGFERKVFGKEAGVASLVLFSAFLMTLAKTVLYGEFSAIWNPARVIWITS